MEKVEITVLNNVKDDAIRNYRLFKWELVEEKAGLKENTFDGNEYTEYGNIMEPKIRDYINKQLGKTFVEGKHIDGDIRCHTDGEDYTTILEIKTTSQIHNTVDEYKVYLVQLLFYMEHTNRSAGMLVVYDRPEDFSEAFDEKRLQIFTIRIENYKELVDKINKAVDQFRVDITKAKENPLITEDDLLPVEIKEKASQIEAIEDELSNMKKLEERKKTFMAELKTAMEENGIKKWITPRETKFTLVEDAPDKEVEVEYYDEDKFIAENTELHQAYHNKLAEYKETRKEIKKGKKGYVLVTFPKEKENE